MGKIKALIDTNVLLDHLAHRYLSALPYHPDMVITRDKKGFNDLNILVMTPAEFVQKARE